MSFADEIEKFSKTALKKATTIEKKLPVSDDRIDDLLYKVPPFANIFIGSEEGARNLKELERNKISHILCVAPDIPSYYPDKVYFFTDNSNFFYMYFLVQFNYFMFPILDVDDQDLKEAIQKCLNYIEEATSNGGNCLIHCQLGVSRSASVCIAYAMSKSASKPFNLDVYMEDFRKVRPKVQPNSGFMKQLREFAEKGSFSSV